MTQESEPGHDRTESEPAMTQESKPEMTHESEPG